MPLYNINLKLAELIRYLLFYTHTAFYDCVLPMTCYVSSDDDFMHFPHYMLTFCIGFHTQLMECSKCDSKEYWQTQLRYQTKSTGLLMSLFIITLKFIWFKYC